MTDRYQPDHRGGRAQGTRRETYEQHDRYGYNPHYDARGDYDNHYRDRRDGRYSDRYEPRPDPRLVDPRYDRYPPPQLPQPPMRRSPPRRYDNGYEGEFTFRGAAARDEPRSARPQEDFSFRAPAGPRFPSPDLIPPPPPDRPRRREDALFNKRGARGQPGRRGGGARGRGRGRGAAHTRDILYRTGRDTTPEQLHGMNGDGARFDVNDLTSGDEHENDKGNMDLNGDSDGEMPRKRVNTGAQQPAVPEEPKWSNPDPYTSLPPPETLGAPKKDIVKSIRNAKVQESQKPEGANSMAGNADFISFNMDDDDMREEAESDFKNDSSAASDREDSDVVADQSQSNQQRRSLLNAPTAPRAHQDPGAPPAPPTGFVMPTDQELMATYANQDQGRKRKRDDQAKGAKDVTAEWRSDGRDPTPWLQPHSHYVQTPLMLHKEIADFYEFVRPYEHEEAIRRDLIHRVQAGIRSLNTSGAKSAEVHCFGSFAAGLYLPVADMDLVAVSPGFMRTGNKTFCQAKRSVFIVAKHFEQIGLATIGTVSPVAKARVPIVKFVDKQTGIKVDISFENMSGLTANGTFERWIKAHPAMRVIVTLIKQMLAMRDLNEVFTGGLGGFSIICLVIHMMEMMPEIQTGNMDPQQHYGELFMRFLDLYGNQLNYRETGLVMNPVSYYNKVANPFPKQNMTKLTIIDPNNEGNDISGGSNNIEAVFGVFRSAYSTLQRKMHGIEADPDRCNESILGEVLGGNYASFYRQREKLDRISRGQRVSPARAPPPKPGRAPRGGGRGGRGGGRGRGQSGR